MKKFKMLFVILFSGILSSTTVYCQYQFHENEFIKEDSMNLAIFVLDFESYEFIEANVTHYPLCDSCDYLELPFNIEFLSPLDFGFILFNYTHNNDTLFDATIVWAGEGEINHPNQFLPAASFETTNNHVPMLDNAQYYDYWLVPNYCSWEEFKQRADSAWRSIDSLLIVNEYGEYSSRVGFYAYTPSVGMLDPSVARWIVFLYYGNDYLTNISVEVPKNNLLKIYPNPSLGSISISNYLSIINRPFEIINTQNKIVLQGKITNESISLSELRNGIYLFRVWTGTEFLSRKIILRK